MQEVYDFLKTCGVYYLATVEGDQPHVRPFGSLDIFENRLYFQTGRIKNVSRQMGANPKVELCAFDGKGRWIRITAITVEDDRLEARQHMLDSNPKLKSMYKADDGNTQVFYLKEATAAFYSFTSAPKTIRF